MDIARTTHQHTEKLSHHEFCGTLCAPHTLIKEASSVARYRLKQSQAKLEVILDYTTGPEEGNFGWSGQRFQKMRGGASHRDVRSEV